ncbi:hypothetical protein HPP92_004632 [Vanilla planifolia]|uniref:Uncharacterized protein n=1 Tax=Vanilla planifolia TaxID=51239 RepID=A0A835RX43_VANPL|nr:hypothetical protein HPP92_004632 [Vanilla planifolia]
MAEFAQPIFLASQSTNGIGETEEAAIERMAQLSKEGFETMMTQKKLRRIGTCGLLRRASFGYSTRQHADRDCVRVRASHQGTEAASNEDFI